MAVTSPNLHSINEEDDAVRKKKDAAENGSGSDPGAVTLPSLPTSPSLPTVNEEKEESGKLIDTERDTTEIVDNRNKTEPGVVTEQVLAEVKTEKQLTLLKEIL